MNRCWALLLFSTVLGVFATGVGAAPVAISPAKMPVVARVDPRFLSYNIEMAGIVGASFWKPYRDLPRGKAFGGTTFASRLKKGSPLDLHAPTLRHLAAALGPAYVRVSGTWANTVYFADTDSPPATAPPGFKSVLTRGEWSGVLAFVKAVDGRLVTSFASSAGVRNHEGVWRSSQAAKLLAFTRTEGGRIAAAEFMNEPNFPAAGGLPAGYSAADFARDFARFRAFARRGAPRMAILGPSATGDTLAAQGMPLPSFIPTAALLAAKPHPRFDVFTYHFYGAVSLRCAPPGTPVSTTAGAALSNEWLDRTEVAYHFYERLRDRYEPGTPIWITETADAACGGNPWAKTFLDSFRFLNQLGAMSRRGVQVVMHNTLVGSDYGLLDERTLAPRPDYWAALLWKRLMGRKVLQAGPAGRAHLRIYAHCLHDVSGGAALLLLNTSKSQAQRVTVDAPARRYTLTAQVLQSESVRLNGRVLAPLLEGRVPPLRGRPESAGVLRLPPASITFLAIPKAGNASCERR